MRLDVLPVKFQLEPWGVYQEDAVKRHTVVADGMTRKCRPTTKTAQI
jgi:hypothetical protein